MLTCSLLLVAAKTGTVRLHLTDAHNRPIAGHEIWLTETNSTKPIRPFGFQWGIPGGPFHGVTGKTGDVAIPGVPLRKPMMVVTKFGPRFDPFVAKNGNASGGSLDVMKFEGAVYAGRRAHVVLANDREISGTVTDAAGKPMPGIEVTLSDTGFGHMGGYPGTTCDLQKTDARGFYRFAALPNCAFSLFALAPKGTAVQASVDKEKSQVIATADMWTSASALPTNAKTTCNFRIIQTATVTTRFKGTAAEFKGWTAEIYAGDLSLGGQLLDYDSKSSTITREALPGPVTVWVSRDRGEIWYVAAKFKVKPGEVRNVDISMAEVLKRRQRR